MLRNTSDSAEDAGRRDSERQLRSKPAAKWLDDVVTQAEGDHGKLAAIVDREKRAMDEMHHKFRGSLETALDADNPQRVGDRKQSVQKLLDSADAMLKLYNRADDKTGAAFGEPGSHLSIEQSRRADLQRTKEILMTGKRIQEGELGAVEQEARAKQLMGKDEIYHETVAIFGAAKKPAGGDVEKSLSYVERGVRRMVRGVE